MHELIADVPHLADRTLLRVLATDVAGERRVIVVPAEVARFGRGTVVRSRDGGLAIRPECLPLLIRALREAFDHFADLAENGAGADLPPAA